MVIRDKFPVTLGHIIIVSALGKKNLGDLSDEEVVELHWLIRYLRNDLRARYGCDGFTIGVNDGEAAGQTVDVLHVHVIPRYYGDTPRPEGGIRAVIPGKQTYEEKD